jgi:hypothetical protein
LSFDVTVLNIETDNITANNTTANKTMTGNTMIHNITIKNTTVCNIMVKILWFVTLQSEIQWTWTLWLEILKYYSL